MVYLETLKQKNLKPMKTKTYLINIAAIPIYLLLLATVSYLLGTLYTSNNSISQEVYPIRQDISFLYLQFGIFAVAAYNILTTFINHRQRSAFETIKYFCYTILLLVGYIFIIFNLSNLIEERANGGAIANTVFIAIIMSLTVSFAIYENQKNNHNLARLRMLLLAFHIVSFYFFPAFSIALNVFYIIPFCLANIQDTHYT